jgi:hypothetical protein
MLGKALGRCIDLEKNGLGLPGGDCSAALGSVPPPTHIPGWPATYAFYNIILAGLRLSARGSPSYNIFYSS